MNGAPLTALTIVDTCQPVTKRSRLERQLVIALRPQVVGAIDQAGPYRSSSSYGFVAAVPPSKVELPDVVSRQRDNVYDSWDWSWPVNRRFSAV